MKNEQNMNPDKNVLLVLAGMVLFFVFSCSKEKPVSVLQVTDVENSSCKNGSLKSVFPDYPESVAYKTVSLNCLSVTHVNAVFNCCLPAGILVKAKIRNDSLLVYEDEKEPGTCNCICPYDIQYTLGPLVYGQYVFVLMRSDGEIRKSVTFRFDQQTDGVFYLW